MTSYRENLQAQLDRRLTMGGTESDGSVIMLRNALRTLTEDEADTKNGQTRDLRQTYLAGSR